MPGSGVIDWGGTNSPYYNGKSLLNLKSDVLSRLRQPDDDHSRYSASKVISALNDAQLEVAVRLGCLHSFAIINLKATYPQYAPPSQMLSPKYAAFYPTTSLTSFSTLKFRSRDWLDSYTSGWRGQSSNPTVMFPGDSYGGLRKLGFYPIPDTDGTTMVIADNYGVVASGTGLSVSGNITGTNTTASATVCTDTDARDIAGLGVKVGMIARNSTDGSQGQISAISGVTFTVTLAGGTGNTWAIGDSFLILAGEYGVVTGLTYSDEQFVFSSEYGEIDTSTPLAGNVYLEFTRRPIPLVYDTQYPEVPIELHQYLPDYAAWLLKRGAPKGSDDQLIAMECLQVFDRKIPPVAYHGLDDIMQSSTIKFNW